MVFSDGAIFPVLGRLQLLTRAHNTAARGRGWLGGRQLSHVTL